MPNDRWLVLNPSGIVPAASGGIAPRPHSLDGKTVLLRWNGKHNGDVFLSRIGERLAACTQGTRIVKVWEALPESANTSQNAEVSRELAVRIASLKPDIVIGAPGD